VSISSLQKDVKIYYTLDGSMPQKNAKLYQSPFVLRKNTVVNAIAIDAKGTRSFVVTGKSTRFPNNYSVTLLSDYEQQYSAGGANGLIDGVKGDVNWRMGNWQGYQNADPLIVIDLKELKPRKQVTMQFLQDTRSWIFVPQSIVVEASADSSSFTLVAEKKNLLAPEEDKPTIVPISIALPSMPIRYIRIRAKQFGKLPAWHEGAGGDSHIFIDEITVQ
jgi:hypothetical protein